MSVECQRGVERDQQETRLWPEVAKFQNEKRWTDLTSE